MDSTKKWDYVKALRTNQTDAEKFLWYRIRNRQLEGLKFRRQVPIDQFIVDFICFEKRLILEIDGGQHNEEANTLKDEKRTKFFEMNGYTVLRFWNTEILSNIDGVVAVILKQSNPSS